MRSTSSSSFAIIELSFNLAGITLRRVERLLGGVDRSWCTGKLSTDSVSVRDSSESSIMPKTKPISLEARDQFVTESSQIDLSMRMRKVGKKVGR